jgi:hypothetical protein
MALLRARARDGVLDMSPDVHDPKEPDIVDLTFATRPVVACGREQRMSIPTPQKTNISK